MSSIAETTKRSKKTRRLGPVRVIRPEQYEAFDVNSKLECIQALIPLGLMRIQELLEDDVCALAGARYERKASRLPGYRHGSNPGSVRLAGQRHPFPIPRVQYVGGGEMDHGTGVFHRPHHLAHARGRHRAGHDPADAVRLRDPRRRV